MKMLYFLFFLFYFNFIDAAGEIDGKGIICKIYGDTIGYFLRTIEHMNINLLVVKKT